MKIKPSLPVAADAVHINGTVSKDKYLKNLLIGGRKESCPAIDEILAGQTKGRTSTKKKVKQLELASHVVVDEREVKVDSGEYTT
jgi:hypothetical protein